MKNEEKRVKSLIKIFKSFPQIKLVYLFGSRATKTAGPLSDYDFAFYADEKDSRKIFDLKFELINKISLALKTERIDVISLNDLKSPELKFHIIKDGKLIFKREPFKIIVESKIMTDYFDFHQLLLRYNLTTRI